jgi:hypothetical protein
MAERTFPNGKSFCGWSLLDPELYIREREKERERERGK